MLLKKNHPIKYITLHSDKILKQIEGNSFFQQADRVALYHALPGEVQTAAFIEKWYTRKQLLLPVVQGTDLSLQLYTGNDALKTGSLGILEPIIKTKDTIRPDLIIVPGIAFDRQLNRLGRGKGYYDRLLSDISTPCIGICFHFQLFDLIPTDTHDRKMSMIITEQEIIS